MKRRLRAAGLIAVAAMGWALFGATPAVAETESPPCAAVWSSTTTYSGGEEASHHGHNWRASWWTQAVAPGAGSIWVDQGSCVGGGQDFVVSEEEFDEIFPDRDPFYTYEGIVDALNAYPQFASVGTETTRAREAAAFLAQADFESVGLQYVKEINEDNYWIKCDHSQPFGCPAGEDAYYGRGPIMFSWNFNYKAAGDALGIDLLNDPWQVEQDPSIAWQTALWYWNTQEGPGVMTSHEAMVSGSGFGQTINALNGSLECDGGNPESVAARGASYERIVEILGVTPGSGVTC